MKGYYFNLEATKQKPLSKPHNYLSLTTHMKGYFSWQRAQKISSPSGSEQKADPDEGKNVSVNITRQPDVHQVQKDKEHQ